MTDEKTLLRALRTYFPLGFPLSRQVWEWLEMSDLTGTYEPSDHRKEIYMLRQVADRFNERHFHRSHVASHVHAGELLSMGVIVDILRYVAGLYSYSQVPGVLVRGQQWVGARKGPHIAERTPPTFVDLFPPLELLKGETERDRFLQEKAEVGTNSERAFIEMILLTLSVENPAFKPFRDFFDDTELTKRCPYVPFVIGMEEFVDNQEPFKTSGEPLFEFLRKPMKNFPGSLDDQLKYIREHWGDFLPADLMERLLLATDVLREEELLRGQGGPGPQRALDFLRGEFDADVGYGEPAAFSRDADWMSNVVLIAKTVYVWLDQLSKKYKRRIQYLNEVPDEELDQLARWGFTGLWLIGIWERSPASRKIKQIMGNPEAASSAYSLYDYVVSAELGGEQAYENLRDRCVRRGIRLASDMVPNHMGIFSKWVVEHPDWFIQLDYPPFPSYQFTGMDLSDDERVCIQIEDGYWQHRDAAVVFKRIDKWTGDAKYIYHGNDGTSMPWNDTAQLNFMRSDVREAVIQTILHVARKFSIIRFDAAMTLAKRHYHRLWFPQHGEGGAIPSRAEYGMTRQEFDKQFPKEFWREVVDRVAQEVPDTLLLAEAFWLMEGYFVRTLGMHRVYNSAFMNMLKMEDNAKYRQTIKNVLEFSPEVLKRFVNFMSNPDEATAIAQFDRGDKYYGVAVLMVTMPGLPMFGHGQIEGLSEKYGMEYRKAYWDEQPDMDMVRRHENEVFPLMRRRKLFSGAENFALYDFNTPDGWVDESVFAYSNRADDERAIIIYNNAYNTTRGWINMSTAINVGESDNKDLVRKTLAEALALRTEDNYYYIYRDYKANCEFLRAGKHIAEHGMYVELQGYEYHAYLDFREIYDHDGSWADLDRQLYGGGVPSIDEAYREKQHEAVISPFRDLLREVVDSKQADQKAAKARMSSFLSSVARHLNAEAKVDQLVSETFDDLKRVPIDEHDLGKTDLDGASAEEITLAVERYGHGDVDDVMRVWTLVRSLGELAQGRSEKELREFNSRILDEWFLRKAMIERFREIGLDESRAWGDAQLVKILVSNSTMLGDDRASVSPTDVLVRLLEDPATREYLQVNRHEDVHWLKKERLERLMSALLSARAALAVSGKTGKPSLLPEALDLVETLVGTATEAGYQIEKIVQALEPDVEISGKSSEISSDKSK